jgi:cell division protein DivIC
MKKVLKIITNKYLIATVVFAVWTVFFDQNDWFTLQQKQKELNTVKDNIAYLNTEIVRMNAEKNSMLTDPKRLEKYARETYRLRHKGEDVYVIEK